MKTLKEILAYYGMPEDTIGFAVQQIAETYGAQRYLDGVADGAQAVEELGKTSLAEELLDYTKWMNRKGWLTDRLVNVDVARCVDRYEKERRSK